MYLPDLPRQAYRNLLDELEQEFTYTFGGCTTLRGLGGSYLSLAGNPVRDRINVLFTDTPFTLDDNVAAITRYGDQLRDAALEALDEEAILVVVAKVFHAKSE